MSTSSNLYDGREVGGWEPWPDDVPNDMGVVCVRRDERGERAWVTERGGVVGWATCGPLYDAYEYAAAQWDDGTAPDVHYAKTAADRSLIDRTRSLPEPAPEVAAQFTVEAPTRAAALAKLSRVAQIADGWELRSLCCTSSDNRRLAWVFVLAPVGGEPATQIGQDEGWPWRQG